MEPVLLSTNLSPMSLSFCSNEDCVKNSTLFFYGNQGDCCCRVYVFLLKHLLLKGCSHQQSVGGWRGVLWRARFHWIILSCWEIYVMMLIDVDVNMLQDKKASATFTIIVLLLSWQVSLDNSAMLRNLCHDAGADVHMLQDKKASVTFTIIVLLLSWQVSHHSASAVVDHNQNVASVNVIRHQSP